MMVFLMMVGVVYMVVSIIVTLILIAIFAVSGRTNNAPQQPAPSTEPGNQITHPQQTHIQSA